MYEFEVIIYHVCTSNYAVSLGSTSKLPRANHVPYTVQSAQCSHPVLSRPLSGIVIPRQAETRVPVSQREAIKGIIYYFNEI